MKKITPAIIGPGPNLPSRISPMGVPTSSRHLVAYHNPDTMGYEFWECSGFSVLTNHRYNDLTRDIVWVIGRRSGAKSYYLDCRFQVKTVTRPPKDEGFRYKVAATDGFVFFPYTRLNGKSWMQKLLTINPHLSLGLQVIKDASILNGLRHEYEVAKAWQEGR